MRKSGINGLGRISRAAFKMHLYHPDLEVSAINDLIPTDKLAYMLRYDSVYGSFKALMAGAAATA
jgi:glyceraldehyde 3-phosphate dehydrogenase